MGGCQTCRVTDFGSQWSFQSFRNGGNQNSTGLLNYKQRIAWDQNLQIVGLPAEGFWEANYQYKHVCFKQIKKDVLRTFPDAAFFGHKANIDRFELLLQKTAVYFPRVGYTQGINFLAGYILLCGFDDDAAFDMLVRICVHDKILALGMYQDQFPLNRFYCELFWKLLHIKIPKLAQKMAKARLPDEMWIFQWFISFFLYSFPIEVVKSFWNYILLKKEFSLVLIALGIVKCLKKDLMELQDDEIQYFEFFQNLKSLEYFKEKVEMKKILNFANGVTKSQIDQAIHETTCIDNPYRKYFECKNQMSQKEQWIQILTKLEGDRRSFRMNPGSTIYQRNREAAQHLECFMVSKINKLYQSDARKSKANFRNSNFSLMKSISAVHSLPQNPQFGKKAQSYNFQQTNPEMHRKFK